MFEDGVVGEIGGFAHALSVRDEGWRANDRPGIREPLDEFGRQVDAAFRAAPRLPNETARNGDRGQRTQNVKYLSGPVNSPWPAPIKIPTGGDARWIALHFARNTASATKPQRMTREVDRWR
jgi:hypothetical protein